VDITEMGMAMPIITVEEKLRRKNSRMRTASRDPCQAASLTLLMAALMNWELSPVAEMRRLGYSLCRRATSSQTPSQTFTVLKPDCL
jgi:hypothetical protein